MSFQCLAILKTAASIRLCVFWWPCFHFSEVDTQKRSGWVGSQLPTNRCSEAAGTERAAARENCACSASWGVLPPGAAALGASGFPSRGRQTL